jgi:hypothetical protein
MFLNSNFYLYLLKGGKDMKGINFKKAFLLSGILLLSVFVVFQLSWACDDDDKWDRDCHDKWDWDHHCWTCNPPKIQRVFLDYNPDDPNTFIKFTIEGKNFAKGGSPVVTLGGMYELDVEDDYSDTRITAILPIAEQNNFEYGDYRLVVSTCHDSSCEYKYCKDYCFKCKEKHCRDYCSKCKERYCKHNYCKEHEYKCRCKDRYSLTIANPSGPQGPSGTFVTVIVTATHETFTCDDETLACLGTASCAEGYRVTGGGFSLGQSTRVTVMESKPSTKAEGWELVVPAAGDVYPLTAPSGVTVWAVCGKIQ